MIGLRWARIVRPALVAVLLMAGLMGEPDLMEEAVTCLSVSSGDSMSLSCGDPEFEAKVKANALTPEEAKAIGCPPIQWEDDGAAAGALTVDTQEPVFVGNEPTYVPRTPDPGVTARVNQAWDRVERWLGAHASATLRKLKFGADPQDLARWEADHGRRLPDDLYVSYLRHDGADGNLGAGFRLPRSYGLLGASDIDYVNGSKCEDLVMAGDLDAADGVRRCGTGIRSSRRAASCAGPRTPPPRGRAAPAAPGRPPAPRPRLSRRRRNRRRRSCGPAGACRPAVRPGCECRARASRPR
ncbi:hypothetical protein [Microbispora siamensis]|uniref:Knr4/Smi1-like domain-containing protein n=1 Tax=Microbispora siamensis TaxID=564413 RepID=A0ABQ4GG98_9ACTN|nr:hypothetical protein [Microbispora siamensis]GIH60446.1 hypothetical protein Msi02_12630 [Microbispora siamensis]